MQVSTYRGRQSEIHDVRAGVLHQLLVVENAGHQDFGRGRGGDVEQVGHGGGVDVHQSVVVDASVFVERPNAAQHDLLKRFQLQTWRPGQCGPMVRESLPVSVPRPQLL